MPRECSRLRHTVRIDLNMAPYPLFPVGCRGFADVEQPAAGRCAQLLIIV